MASFRNSTAAFTISSLLCAAGANAASVNSLITSVSGPSVVFGLDFADSDKSIILNSDGSVKSSGALVVGDIILGVIDIDEVSGVGGTADFGGVNNELTGIYALGISDFSGAGTLADPSVIETLALTQTQITGAGLAGLLSVGGFGANSAMIALFEDSSDDYDELASFNAQLGTASNGDFFQSFGGSDAFWNIIATNAAIFDAGQASAASTNTTLANVVFGLNLVETGTSFLSPIASDEDGDGFFYDVNPGDGANTLLGGGGGPVNSDLSFSMIATPSPSAAVFGLCGLVMMGVRRRRSVQSR